MFAEEPPTVDTSFSKPQWTLSSYSSPKSSFLRRTSSFRHKPSNKRFDNTPRCADDELLGKLKHRLNKAEDPLALQKFESAVEQSKIQKAETKQVPVS